MTDVPIADTFQFDAQGFIVLRGALHRQLPPGQRRPKSNMAPALVASFVLLLVTFIALLMKASVH